MSIERVELIVSEVKPKEPLPSLDGLRLALADVKTSDISRLKNIQTAELRAHWIDGYNAIQAWEHHLGLDLQAKLQRKKSAAHDAAEKGKNSGMKAPDLVKNTKSPRSGPK